MTDLLAAAVWLGETPWSVTMRQSLWAYPAIETVHVLAICLFAGFAALVDLRLLGVVLPQVCVSTMMTRVMPWAWAGFGLLVVTGSLLFLGDPARFAGNVFFQIKALLLGAAGLNAAIFHTTIYRRVVEWDRARVTPLAARVAGALSLGLWILVVVSGRLIAYR